MNVLVKSPLQHNKKLFKVGATTDLDDAIAEQLIADGVVERVAPQKQEPKRP